MKEHEATELSYKHGYEKGKADGAREIFEALEEYILLEWNEEAYAELKNKYAGGKL